MFYSGAHCVWLGSRKRWSVMYAAGWWVEHTVNKVYRACWGGPVFMKDGSALNSVSLSRSLWKIAFTLSLCIQPYVHQPVTCEGWVHSPFTGNSRVWNPFGRAEDDGFVCEADNFGWGFLNLFRTSGFVSFVVAFLFVSDMRLSRRERVFMQMCC